MCEKLYNIHIHTSYIYSYVIYACNCTHMCVLVVVVLLRRRVVTQYGVDSLKNMEQLNKFAEIYINSHRHTNTTKHTHAKRHIHAHQYVLTYNLRENVLRNTDTLKIFTIKSTPLEAHPFKVLHNCAP